ncbi:MAG: glutamine synthetase family protein [Microthrixaceae bacterium]
MQHQQEYVLRTVEERRVRLVRLWFTDVLGQLKSVAISPVELEAAFAEGVQFDGSAIDGFSRMQESDVLARPDPNSFQLMPTDDGETTARVFCDIANLDGSPFEGDPRQVLRRNLGVAADSGFEFMCAPEVEFFYFEPSGHGAAPVPLDEASYFDLTANDSKGHIRRRTIQRLEATGIPVEYSFHEDAPSQHEIDLRYSDALTMADNVMALRMIVREVAMSGDVYATFMPKPMEGPGLGHAHPLSLWSAGANAFHDPEARDGLSDVARSFIAGILAHARDHGGDEPARQLLQAAGRRLQAPVNISWAHNDRTALVRVPVPKREQEARATRISTGPWIRRATPTWRSRCCWRPDWTASPGATDSVRSRRRRCTTRRPSGTPGLLPANLSEALGAMESSELVLARSGSTS